MIHHIQTHSSILAPSHTYPCTFTYQRPKKTIQSPHYQQNNSLRSSSSRRRHLTTGNQPLRHVQTSALPPTLLPDNLSPFLTNASSLVPGLLTGSIINTLVYIFGIKVLLKGLTWPGVLSSWFLGTLTYSAFGPGAYSIVCLYFIVGSLVTKLKLEQKQKEGIAEARSGRRGIGSVLGSGFAGILCALVSLTIIALSSSPSSQLHTIINTTTTPSQDILTTIYPWRVGFIASFASKLADTASSEVGKAYGKTTYLITTLQRVPRGTEGAISVEGTLAGVVAAAGIACVAVGLGQVDLSGGLSVVIAAVVANIMESALGASVQGKVEWLTNDVVNVLQISVAAMIGVVLSMYMI